MDYQELNLKSGQILTAEHMAHIEKGIDTVTTEVTNMKKARIVLRNDVTQEWIEVEDTVVLLQGEPGVEFTADGLTKIKIGDGVSTWKALPYISTNATADVDFSTLTWGKLANSGQTEKGALTEALEFRTLGYGDKVDITSFNTNIGITEQYLVDLLASQSSTNTDIISIQKTLDAHQTSIDESIAAITANEKNIKALEEDTGEAVTLLDGRLDTVEGEMHHVDFLVGELTNGLEATDAPLELIDMRVDINGNTFDSAGAHVRAIEQDINRLKDNLSDYVDITVPDGLIYEGNKLYLAAKGEAISEPVEIVGGSGGGGSGGSYTINLTNLLDSRFLSVTKNEKVILKFRYSSEDDDGYNDGAGIGTLTINGLRKASTTIEQGENELDITQYLATGENIVSIKVVNTEGYSRTLSYTVNVVALTLTTNFPNMSTCEGDVVFQYRVTGIGNKKIYFFLDGRDLKSENITADDVTRTKTIPAQTDGPHYLRVYVESTKDGVTVKSEELNIGLLWKSNATTFPMIMFNYNEGNKTQGETITIPYLVFDPHHLASTAVAYTIYNEDGSIYYTRAGEVEPVGKEWNVQDYPAGNVRFEIACRGQSNSINIQIAPSTFDSTIIRDNSLLMEFTAQNRANSDINKDKWSYGDYEATFTNFSWTDVDGWLTDSKGGAVLRFLPANEMYIPFKPFDYDIRSTGYTIEVELASHNVCDYDSTLIASFESDCGFIVKSQNATLQSQSSGTSVQFKEDERIRVTFVVAKDSTTPLIYIYINGILCSVTPYPPDDNFKQPNPVGLTIGAKDCGIDLYALRFYGRAFNAKEQLNNFICDRSTVAERIAADKRNDILDLANTENEDDIVLSFDKVQGILPIMIMRCAQLPKDKEKDKFKGQHIDYIDLLHPEYSFSADDCTFQVQGTSSSEYPVKNFKIKLGSGLTYTQSGETAAGWLFDKERSIETKVFCLKADFASSEHSNNVNLVDYYNDTTPYLMPPQQVESQMVVIGKDSNGNDIKVPKVRQGVNGRPIILFWENTETGELKCQGSYNLNDDKSNEKTFGFKDIDITSIIPEPRIECWEWCNNGNDLCLFLGTDAFEQTKIDPDTKQEYPAWHDDLEPRFPDLDDHYYGDEPGELDAIRPLIEWVVSTNPLTATGAQFETAQYYPYYKDYNGNIDISKRPLSRSFTHDTADYRLSKFKAEFHEYFILNAMLFYYLFTEVFHLMDSRAKNMFLTTFDGKHFFPIPYDMDTAMGINNEGTLTYDYNCEDTEEQDGKGVFTGQDSVLWNNVRDCFTAELNELYGELRSDPNRKFSYDEYIRRANEHQEQWSEMCWNYDAQFKYLDTYEQGYSSLAALQGNKKAQREWWLYNAFKYRDSKYGAGDAKKNRVLIRTNGKGTLNLVPYSHIYAEVEWGQQGTERKRAYRNETVSFSTPEGAAQIENLETHIYSADRIADLGDLSPFEVGYCDVGEATKLQRLLLGSTREGYRNGMLTNVIIKKNELLQEIDVSNCYNLGIGSNQGDIKTLDASNCPCLEIFRGQGTALKGVDFSNGGRLKEIYLPRTITSLILRNQKKIEILDVESYENVATLGLTNIPDMNIEELVAQMPKLNRIALENVSWTATNEETLMATITKLAACDGLKIDGTTLIDQPILTGRVYIDELSDDALEEINMTFPGLTVVVNGVPKFFIRYRNYYNEVVYHYVANEGDAAIDPVNPPEGWPDDPIPAPEVPDTETMRLTWTGWSEQPESIHEPYDIIATYDASYYVTFYDNNGEIGNQQWVNKGESAIEPVTAGLMPRPSKESTAQYNYTFSGWDMDYTAIDGSNLVFYPVFREDLRSYWVYFYNDDKKLQEGQIKYGDVAVFKGDVNDIKKMIGSEASPYYEFTGWSPDPSQPIVENTTFYAQFAFDGYIEDSWEEIIEACKAGNTDKYGLGGRKTLTYTFSGIESTVEMEIVGKNHDTLATVDPSYNGGASTAALSFMACVMGAEMRPMNQEVPTWDNGSVDSEGNPNRGYNNGGWAETAMRKELQGEFFNILPAYLQNNIKPVLKLSDRGYYAPYLHETTDTIWLPSATELNGEFVNEVVLNQGKPYPLFNLNPSRIKRNQNGNPVVYWTRSSGLGLSHFFTYVASNGYVHYTGGGSNSYSVAFGFCL